MYMFIVKMMFMVMSVSVLAADYQILACKRNTASQSIESMGHHCFMKMITPVCSDSRGFFPQTSPDSSGNANAVSMSESKLSDDDDCHVVFETD